MKTNRNFCGTMASTGEQQARRKVRPLLGDRTWLAAITSLFLLLLSSAVTYPFEYTTANGTVTITGGLGGDVTIPSTINGLPVTGIGYGAFAGLQSLTSIIIPNSVTNIGVAAFQMCSYLTSVTLGTNVTSIGDSAFQWCGLTSVTIPNSVTSIGVSAFGVCRSLTSVTIGSNVTNINGAFTDCTRLTNVTIPSSVTSGAGTFVGCTSLTAIMVDASNSFYSSVAGVLFDKNQTTLIEYPEGLAGAYAIPNSVTSIGVGAFGGCTGLTSITIPNSVTNIGGAAFGGCTSLTSVTVPNSVTSIGDSAFYGCTSLTNVMIPNGVTNIGEDGFNGCTSLKGVYFLGNAPTVIPGSYPFSGDANATVYYVSGTTGWGTTFGYRPTAIWKETVTVTANPSQSGTLNGGGTDAVGSSQQISATANSCWAFTSWNDGNTQNPRTITVPLTNITYTAEFSQQTATVSVQANPSNGGTASGGGSYPCGSLQQVTASANSGWVFTGWSDGSVQAPHTIAVPSGGATYTASFSPAAAITVQANPFGGGTVSGDGMYAIGSSQQISAVANGGWVFTGWSDGGAQTHNITVSSGGETYTANFQPTATITVQANPSTAGSVSGSGTYEVGSAHQISAAAKSGWVFTGWSDGGAQTHSITVPSTNITYTATFSPTAAITAKSNPSSGGTVSGGGTYPVGNNVQITASANSGWVFTGWSDGNTQNPRTITVPVGGTTYTANFSPASVTTVQANPSGGGTGSGGGTYTVGSSQQITASANSGWMFTGWSDGNTQNPRTITVQSGGATYTANFMNAQGGSIVTPTFSGVRGLYDLTHSLTNFSQDFYNSYGDMVTISESLSVVQSITGALTAGGTYTTVAVESLFYNFTFPATYTFKGSVKSSGSTILMSLLLTGKGSSFVDGATRQLSETITYLATLNPSTGIMTLRETGTASESGQGSSKIINPNYSGPVLPQFTGICTPIDWYLGMTLASNGAKVTGNAAVILKNGRSFPFTVRGTYTARTGIYKLTLTGTGAGKGATLTVTMAGPHITGITGSLLGQQVKLSGL